MLIKGGTFNMVRRLLSSNNQLKFDMVVLGGGPGGYVATLRGAQSGLKVACIDEKCNLGGTCLNEGCIPSKVLLHVGEKLRDAKSNFEKIGLERYKGQVNFKKTAAFRDKVIADFNKGIHFLFKKNGVKAIQGTGKIESENSVIVKTPQGEERICTENIVISTGSKPVEMNGILVDGKKVVTSTELLNQRHIPNSLAVIGGGIIGTELGSAMMDLGAKVYIIEASPRLISGTDIEAAKVLEDILLKRGMVLHLSTKVNSVQADGNGVRLLAVEESASGKKKCEIRADQVLVAVGRRPRLPESALELPCTPTGHIEVEENYRVKGKKTIWAIGDVTPGPMLAHRASHDGMAIADIISRSCTTNSSFRDYNAVPCVVYTAPEVAGVGLTEEQVISKNMPFLKGVFPMSTNSRAKATNETSGFMKILIDKKSDIILGLWMCCSHAGELLGPATTAIRLKIPAKQFLKCVVAHPTLSEGFFEALNAAYGTPLHM